MSGLSPMIGAIRDGSGSYDQAFLLVTVLVGIAFMLATLFHADRHGSSAIKTTT